MKLRHFLPVVLVIAIAAGCATNPVTGKKEISFVSESQEIQAGQQSQASIVAEFGTFEQALYFSTVSFSTLGFGDLTLGVNWRVLGAIEAVNGLVLIAWSTAFLMNVTNRLRLLEHEWLEPKG